MNETKQLNKAREIFDSIQSFEQVSRKDKQQVLLNAIDEVLDCIRSEACQTAAGTRWFSGQLKIYSNLDFLNGTLNDQNESKKTEELQNNDPLRFYRNCLNDLQKMIQSGLNRYISG